jgi:uncharacterized membrane protein
MIGASHLGGRLAFIGTGFENGFGVGSISAIAIFHNSMVLLVIYPLFLLMSQRFPAFGFIARFQEEATANRRLRSRWNLLAIAIFIWIPLPMTGAVVGALLAHFEGYPPRQVVPVALGSMAAGVASWTLAFEPLYAWLREIGPYTSTTVTILLVVVPIVVNVLRKANAQP